MVLAFEGWNDAGEAASSAARYVQSAIHAVPLAEIDCEDFLDFTVRRPTVHLDDKKVRRVEWPRVEFQYGSVDSSRELIVGLGAAPHLRWRGFCDLVAELARRLGVSQVLLLGAYLADVVYSRPIGVTGFASSPELLEQLGVTSSSYQGPTGIVGVVADRLWADGIDVVSLWAGLPHYISATPNPRGALALVQKLTDCLGVRIDEAPLRRDAAAFEQKISAIVAADPELAEYVRQLKRRDFAQ